MSLFSSYPSFILPFVWAFVAGVFCHLMFSYRRRFNNLKERTDKTITRLDQELERSGIVLAETRKKVRTLENELSYYKNGGMVPGIPTSGRSASSGLYENTASVKRHTPIERHEAKTTTQVTKEERRRSETTNTDTWDPMLTQQLFASHIANGNYTTRTATLETETKPTYPTYVNTDCSVSRSSDYSSGDSGSSSSDSCSSSSSSSD